MRRLPLERWPGWCADLFEIKLPCNVRKQVLSPEGGANINIIVQLLATAARQSGDVAECGVYRGATLIAMGLYLREAGLPKRAFGFDSFEGFDRSIEFDLDLGGQADRTKAVGGFSETSERYVRVRLDALGLGERVQLFKGYFQDTLSRVARRSYCFVHLDCDIYASYRDCLAYFYPLVVPGGVILFDEYNDPPWPGCNLAVDEFLADRPEKLQVIECDGYQKYFIVKQ